MPRLGILSKFFVNVGTPTTAPSFVELPLISDCTVNGPWDEGEASTREGQVTQTENTKMSLEISGKIRIKKAASNAAYLKMRASHGTGSSFEVLVLNGGLTENGAEGYQFMAKIFNWSEDQSLGTVLYKDFTIKPCIWNSPESAPRIALVVGTVLGYSAIGSTT